MILFSPIRTARLELQLLEPEHVLSYQEYLLSNRAHLAPWEPLRDDSYFELEQCHIRLQQSLAWFHSGQGVSLAAIRQGQIIGICNFSNIVRGVFQACHLGYSIALSHQGQGYMSEAVKAGIDYMFDQRDLHRIMANYLPDNLRSAALLQSLGFEREGYAKSYLKIHGQWRDHVLTALCNPSHR